MMPFTKKSLLKRIASEIPGILLSRTGSHAFWMPYKGVIRGFILDASIFKNERRLQCFAFVPCGGFEYTPLLENDYPLSSIWWNIAEENVAAPPDFSFLENLDFFDAIMVVMKDIIIPRLDSHAAPQALLDHAMRPRFDSTYIPGWRTVRGIRKARDYCLLCIATNQVEEAKSLVSEIEHDLQASHDAWDLERLPTQLACLKDLKQVLLMSDSDRVSWMKAQEEISFKTLKINQDLLHLAS